MSNWRDTPIDGKVTAQLQVKLAATHAGTGEDVIIPVIWP